MGCPHTADVITWNSLLQLTWHYRKNPMSSKGYSIWNHQYGGTEHFADHPGRFSIFPWPAQSILGKCSWYNFSLFYTLLQKKSRFNQSIFTVDPGSLTLTQCHVNFARFLPGALGKWYMMSGSLIYTLLQKKMQPTRTCVSFGEECIIFFVSNLPPMASKKGQQKIISRKFDYHRDKIFTDPFFSRIYIVRFLDAIAPCVRFLNHLARFLCLFTSVFRASLCDVNNFPSIFWQTARPEKLIQQIKLSHQAKVWCLSVIHVIGGPFAATKCMNFPCSDSGKHPVFGS